MGKLLLSLEATHRLITLGARVRAARQSRGWTIAEAAARSGMNRNTLGALEQGKPGVAIGAYAAMLWVLGLDRTLEAVADPSEDPQSTARQETRTTVRVRKRAPS